MGVTTTARDKRDIFLPIIVVILIFALVALYLHTDCHLLTTDGETYEVANAEVILNQMPIVNSFLFTLAFPHAR